MESKWIMCYTLGALILVSILYINLVSAYTAPAYNNVTIVLDNSYTAPTYTNVTIVLDESQSTNCWTTSGNVISIPNGCVYSKLNGINA